MALEAIHHQSASSTYCLFRIGSVAETPQSALVTTKVKAGQSAIDIKTHARQRLDTRICVKTPHPQDIPTLPSRGSQLWKQKPLRERRLVFGDTSSRSSQAPTSTASISPSKLLTSEGLKATTQNSPERLLVSSHISIQILYLMIHS